MSKEQDCSLTAKKGQKNKFQTSGKKPRNTHALPYNHCPTVTYSFIVIHLHYDFDTPWGDGAMTVLIRNI